jgi:hypothetical protein
MGEPNRVENCQWAPTSGFNGEVYGMNRLPGLMHLPDDMGQIDEGTNDDHVSLGRHD